MFDPNSSVPAPVVPAPVVPYAVKLQPLVDGRLHESADHRQQAARPIAPPHHPPTEFQLRESVVSLALAEYQGRAETGE